MSIRCFFGLYSGFTQQQRTEQTNQTQRKEYTISNSHAGCRGDPLEEKGDDHAQQLADAGGNAGRASKNRWVKWLFGLNHYGALGRNGDEIQSARCQGEDAKHLDGQYAAFGKVTSGI